MNSVFIVGILAAMVSAAVALATLFFNRGKTSADRKKVDAEAAQIFNDIATASAQRNEALTMRIEEDNARLRIEVAALRAELVGTRNELVDARNELVSIRAALIAHNQRLDADAAERAKLRDET
jgi:hypothetical protein